MKEVLPIQTRKLSAVLGEKESLKYDEYRLDAEQMYERLASELFKDGAFNIDSLGCPVLWAFELVRLRALLDRYDRIPKPLVKAEQWISLIGLFRQSFSDDILHNKWTCLLEHRVMENGDNAEWDENHVPEDGATEEEEAWDLATEMDNRALLIEALDHIGPFDTELKKFRKELSEGLQGFQRDIALHSQDFFLKLAKPRVELILHDVRPEVFSFPCFRRHMGWTFYTFSGPVPAQTRAQSADIQIPPEWKQDGALKVSTDGWHYAPYELK